MPILPRGGTGGGGGLHFRDPVDVFAANSNRNTYFTTTDATAYLQFVSDRSLAIVIGTLASPTDFQTYTGDASGYANSNWLSRVDAVQGFPGSDGNDGEQGRFYVIIHTNSASQPTPSTPTGGAYHINTGLFTPPTGTTEDPTPPSTGEDVWASQAEINPDIQTGSVTPIWSEWVERSHLSSGISHVEVVAGDLTGTGLVADPVGLDDTRKFEANPAGAATAPLLKVDLGGTIFDVDEIIDVTSTGLPAITEANHRSLFIDFDTPRVWVGHRTPIADTAGSANADSFADTNYLGAFATRPTPQPASTDVYFYDTTNHYFEGGAFYRVNQPLIWSHRDITFLLGASARWLGEQADSNTAANLINNFDASLRYLYFSTASQTVREIRNNSYVEPVNNTNLYTAEPISAPTGVAGIFGVTAGTGLSGGGTSGVVTLNVDATLQGFPVIPIDKGGTGAITAAAALAALGGTTLTDILAAILEGTNVTIDRTTSGQITIAAMGGSTNDGTFIFGSGVPS